VRLSALGVVTDSLLIPSFPSSSRRLGPRLIPFVKPFVAFAVEILNQGCKDIQKSELEVLISTRKLSLTRYLACSRRWIVPREPPPIRSLRRRISCRLGSHLPWSPTRRGPLRRPPAYSPRSFGHPQQDHLAGPVALERRREDRSFEVSFPCRLRALG